MQLKQISGEGYTSYLVYSSDTKYRPSVFKQLEREHKKYKKNKNG